MAAKRAASAYLKREVSGAAMVPAQSAIICLTGVTVMKYFKLVLPLGSLAGTLALAGHVIGLS